MNIVEKLQFFTKNKKQLVSLSVFGSLLLAYLSYKTYIKLKKRQRKFFYDKWFFSPTTNKSQISSLNISQFVSNLRYRIFLCLGHQKIFKGAVKITFFLNQKFSQDFALEFTGQSIFDLEVNGKTVESLKFEKHQINIPKQFLILGQKNIISLKFINAYDHNPAGVRYFQNPKDKNFQIYSAFSFSTSQIFPSFPNFDIKICKIQLVILVSPLEWEALSLLPIKERHLAAYDEGKDIIETYKVQDFLQELGLNSAKLHIFEHVEQIYPWAFSFAAGSFACKEYKLSSGLALKIYSQPKFIGNVSHFVEVFSHAEKGIKHLETFMGKLYPFNQMVQVFCDSKHYHLENASLIAFPDSLISNGYPSQLQKTTYLFIFLLKICQMVLRIQCRINDETNFAFLEALEELLTLKSLFSVRPESGIFYESLPIKKSQFFMTLISMRDVCGEKIFEGTLRSFLARTVIFALDPHEFAYCLEQTVKESQKSEVLSLNILDFFNQKTKNQRKIKISLLKNEKNSLCAAELTENAGKLLDFDGFGSIEMVLFYEKFGELTQRIIRILPHEKKPFFSIDLSQELLDYPDFFFCFSQSLNCFCEDVGSLKLLIKNFHRLGDNYIKTQAFFALERALHLISDEDFMEFCLTQIDLEENNSIREKIMEEFKRKLSVNFRAEKRGIYYDRAFEKLRNRIIHLLSVNQSGKFSQELEDLHKLLDLLHSRKNIQLALAWVHENRVFFPDISLHEIEFPGNPIQNHELWLILRKLFLSPEFSLIEKEEILSEILKKRELQNELEKIRCESIVNTAENKERLWKKTILGEWKNMEVFEASTQDFYEGMEINILEEYNNEFFKAAEAILIMFSREYCEIFWRNFKPRFERWSNFGMQNLKKFKELVDLLGEELVIKELVEEEIERMDEK